MRTRLLWIVPMTIGMLLSGCGKGDDASPPRSPLVQDGAVPQSSIFKVKSDEWAMQGTPGDDTYGYEVTKNVNIITAAVMQHGSVKVYLQRSNGSLSELPLLAGQGGPGGLNLRYQAGVGKVVVTVDQAGQPVTPPEAMLTFKVVVFTN